MKPLPILAVALTLCSTTSLVFAQNNYLQRPNQPVPRFQRQSVPQNSVGRYTPPVVKPRKFNLYPRVASDFEKQRAIILSVSELLPQHEYVFQQIVRGTAGKVWILVLFNNTRQLRDAVLALSKTNADARHVMFYQLELDTIWLRDFGPRMAVYRDKSVAAIDFLYEGTRPRDESFPIRWAKQTSVRSNKVRWTMQGGNLLVNGHGLGLTTSRIFKDNAVRFPNALPGFDPVAEARKMVVDAFTKGMNLQQLVILEPLQNEATKHVDMFATFVAKDKILVAQLDKRHDPMNASILDRNAKRLASIRVDGSPLKVVRIPVPQRQGMFWSPYTNSIIANGVILMPKFDSDNNRITQQAIEVYERELPGHKVVTIDTTTMKKLQGSLHCMSINLPAFAPFPDKIITFKNAQIWAKNLRQPATTRTDSSNR